MHITKIILILSVIIVVVISSGFTYAANCGNGIKTCACGDTLITNYTLGSGLFGTSTCFTIGRNFLTLDCNDFKISGKGSGNGIVGNSLSGITLKNCIIESFSTGARFTASSKIIVQDSIIRNQSSAGIYLEALNSTIQRNSVLNNAGGILIIDRGNNSVRGNTIANNRGNGIDLQSAGGNIITGNAIRNNSQNSISLDTASFNDIWDNDIQDSSVSYTNSKGNDYCVGGVPNRYSDGAVGPTCSCYPPVNGMVVIENTTLCPGTYKLSGGIEIDAHGVVLDCDGSTLRGTRLNDGIQSQFNDDVVIRDCIIENYSDGIVMESDTVFGIFSDRPTISNTISRGNAGNGFELWTINGTVTGSKAVNNGRNGILLKYLRNNTLVGNEFVGNGESGILIDQSSGNAVTKNLIDNNSQNSISLDTASFNDIWDNDIQDSSVSYTNSKGNDYCVGGVPNRYSDGAVGPTCSCYPPVNGMVVIENTTLCPGTYKLSGGIEIDAHGVVLDCDDTVLVGKRIGYGIVSSYDDDILIKNCIVENYSNGIAVTSDTSLGLLADRPIIRNTISRNNAAQGYIFRARNGSFASNKGLNNGADGITLKYLNNNTLNDNEFKNNVGYGINLFDSDGNKIINNNISNNSRGILVESGSLFNTLLRNSFWNNTRGAHLGQGSYGNTFSDNFLQGNSVGIYVDNGTNIISQNSITSSTTFGLFNNAKAQVTAINNFWGTNSGEYIEQAIYDDEESLGAKGKVNFDPWLRKDIGSCDNGIKDSLESDVDCGGVCGPCPDGKKCASNTGCKGKFCSNGVCATVSCNDGFQNGFEEGIDCGWICKKGCPICNGLTINGRSRDKIDVVFVGSGFPNISSWFQTAADFVDYNGSLGGLMSVSPFKENKGKFNFWAVNSLPAFTLEKYEQQARKLGKSACPQWDQLVFLSFEPRFWPHAYIKPYSGIGKKEAFIVAGCEYLGMCEFPLDIARPQDGQDPGNCRGDGGIFFDCANAGDNKFEVVRTLVHEFGHSFGGLMDEYKNAGANPKNPGKVPNCDISGCPKWASLAGITCSSECFYSNWYRPYKNSLMRNSYRPDAEFGEVHRIELEKDINASLKNFFGIFEESSPEYNLSFVAEIIFEEGNLSVRNVSLASGRAENIDDENSSYRAVVFSSLNDTLYSLNFSLALEPVFSPPRSFFDQNDSQVIVPNESDFASVNFTEDAITLPYFIDAERIDILGGNGSAVLSINVSEFQDLDKDFLPRLADNCPEVYNPGQPDSDNNGLGDDCQMFISKGWSLVSFPSWFNPATVRRIGSRLSMDPIKPVLTFKDGHWLNLSPDSEVNTSMALWAYGIRDMNSTIAGIPFNTSQGIELQRGWNLIGYPSGKSIGINETMVSAPITRVYSFRWGDWFSYVKGRDASMNRLQNFTAGWGYWVYSLDDTNLSMS